MNLIPKVIRHLRTIGRRTGFNLVHTLIFESEMTLVSIFKVTRYVRVICLSICHIFWSDDLG